MTSRTKKKIVKVLVGVVIALVCVGATFSLFHTSVMDKLFGSNIFLTLDRKAYDTYLNVRGIRKHTDNLVVVVIDEATLNELLYPIPRDKFGALFAIMQSYGARVIGVDYFFPRVRSNEASDYEQKQFLRFSNMASDVIHAIGPFIPSDDTELDSTEIIWEAYPFLHPHGIPKGDNFHYFPQSSFVDERPFDSLARLSAGVAHVAMVPDSIDGITRKVPFFIEYGGDYYPSLGAATALYSLNVDIKKLTVEETDNGLSVKGIGIEIPLDKFGMLSIDYVGETKFFKEISMYDVLDAFARGDTTTLSIFQNASVIVGPTARSIGDLGPTPISEKSPNCYIHANVYDQIVTKHFITFPKLQSELWLTLNLALSIGVLSLLVSLRWSSLYFVLLITSYFFGVNEIFQSTGLIISFPQAIISFFLTYATAVGYISITEGKQKSEIKNMFTKYVDASVVEKLIDNPEMLKLGGEEKEVTVLFSDIEGSTTIAEKLGPQNTVTLINEYLTDMTNIILEKGGTLDKYIGDAIMAFWGAPLNDPDHAYHACETTLLMQRKLKTLHPYWTEKGWPLILQRVGLNTGKVIVGNVGSTNKFNYTVMGDAINLGSRVEGVNKEYGTYICITEFTHARVAERVITRELDLVVVVGKTEPVRIYELMALTSDPTDDKIMKFREVYSNALAQYKKREWKSAISIWEDALQLREDEKTSKMYIKRAKDYIENPPGDDWRGVYISTKK